MSDGDLLGAYIETTGVRDARRLRTAILHVVDTFMAQDMYEIAQEQLMKELSERFLKEWTFESIKVGGHFPPASGHRHYDGVVETSRAVSARYAQPPHVRVVLDGPRGTQFKLAVVLNCKQTLMPREMKFSEFRINVAIDAAPESLGVDVQRNLIIDICNVLKHQYAHFVRKIHRHCSDLQQVLLNELTAC